MAARGPWRAWRRRPPSYAAGRATDVAPPRPRRRPAAGQSAPRLPPTVPAGRGQRARRAAVQDTSHGSEEGHQATGRRGQRAHHHDPGGGGQGAARGPGRAVRRHPRRARARARGPGARRVPCAARDARVLGRSGQPVLQAGVRPGPALRAVLPVGLAPGASHGTRGTLQSWADPGSPYFQPVFGQGRRFVLYCQSGWRSALATAALQDMGLARVAHVAGGFHAWKAAGGEVARKETRAPAAAATRLAGGQVRIPATYMRGGTSKGVFFRLEDLPEAARVPGPARDALLMRVIGSPDPYGKHTDGMGGATSSTSKCVILSKATVPGHDVDYLYGQVSIDSAFVDWS